MNRSKHGRPRVYTLCGSTQFSVAFELAAMHLSLAGHVVLTAYGQGQLGIPQLRRIDLSDAIFVVNVGGYFDESTRLEIEYAEKTGKDVEWLFGLTNQ